MPLPSSPSVGTKITAAWGSSLLSSLPGKMMGFTSTLTSATSSGTNGTTEALLAGSLLTVTNVEAGRYYTVTFGCKFVVSVANTTALAIVHASQSTITTASPSIYIAQQPVAATAGNQQEQTFTCAWVPGASGTWNLQLGVKSAAGTGNSQITNGNDGVFLFVQTA